jgi:hypothetical protein
MITIIGVLLGTQATIESSGTTYTLGMGSQRYAPEEWETARCTAGAVMYTTDAGVFGVLSSGSNTTIIDIRPQAETVAEIVEPVPQLEIDLEPAPEFPTKS